MPPEYLWDDSEGLDLWWKRVKERREDASSSYGSSGDDEELVENELAREFKR